MQVEGGGQTTQEVVVIVHTAKITERVALVAARHLQPIEGQLDAVGQLGKGVAPQFMNDVREVRFCRSYAVDLFDGLRCGEIRNVRLVLKGVKDEYFGVTHALQAGAGYEVGVCDVTEVSNAKAMYRHVQVHDRQRYDGDAVHRKRIVADLSQGDLRYTGIPDFLERVGVLDLKLCQHVGPSVYRHIRFL